MNIAICGASGCVGSHLSSYLQGAGHNIVPISRELFTMCRQGELQDIVDLSDVVVNLAGAPITKRWSRKNLREIFDSRIGVTKRLVETINRSTTPKLFISASAAGHHLSEQHTSPSGEGSEILAQVVDKWEEQARRVNSKTRLVITRLSVVLDSKQGALPRMLDSHKFGFLASVGSADRAFSWIAVEDVSRAIEHIIEHPEIEGSVNLTTPESTIMAQFYDSAKRRLGVRFTIQLPEVILRLIYGRAAEVILQDSPVHPTRLKESGYRFRHPTIESYISSMSYPH